MNKSLAVITCNEWITLKVIHWKCRSLGNVKDNAQCNIFILPTTYLIHSRIFYLKNSFLVSRFILDSLILYQSWRRGTKCGCKHDRLWVRFQLEEITYLKFPFFRSNVEAKLNVPPLHTECLQNSAENKERSILILGSLCLLFYIRDTIWP